MKDKKSSAIIPIFFTVFIDLLGLGIIIPVLPALLLNPMSRVLPASYSFEIRTVIYGFLIASYPMMQFFGAPVLGTIADRVGRKKILVVSLIGTLIGYSLFIVGIMSGSIWLLFVGRMLDGFTGGNISTAQSAIADISTPESKSRNFGLVGMAFGIGFVIGPYMGGKLADPSFISWFNFSTPFWAAAGLTLMNILLVVKLFPETLRIQGNRKIDFFAGFRNIRKAFSHDLLRPLFVVVFLLTIGFNFFTQFFQVFLIGKFQFNQSQIGDLFAYMGVWIAVSQGMILRPLSKRVDAYRMLNYAIVLLAITFPLLLIPNEAKWIYIIIPFVAIFRGLVQPNATAIVSNQSDETAQGEILGINQSVISLAQAVPPILAGFLTTIDIQLPTWFAAGTTFVAWILFLVTVLPTRKGEKE